MEDDKEQFKNANVLITGANGFIGSHIVKRMIQEGANVTIIVRENADMWRIVDQLPDIQVIIGDLKDDELVLKTVLKAKADYVFHLAAYGVDFRQQDYSEAAKSNILGTINLLNGIRRVGGCSKFLYAGTSMQYGNKEGIITEEMKLEPANIYGSTKAAATLIAHQIAAENNIGITTLIPFGVFGENEGSHKFFPHIILSILDNKDVDLTMCEQYRDYCYIENIVDGFLLAALDRKHNNDIFNIGSGRINQLRRYVDLIFKYMNTTCKPNYGAIEYRKNDLWRPQPDVSKLMEGLGWQPKISLEEGLQYTINWYRANYNRYKEKRR
ncbi:MAG TPA: SDR family NAD(P)-dependent oxidoreductase [Patescibacteria group bacterium]|nr:SDR family NAD(P)-dependent oxidoreductase [Patescibacteria group bacterium]